MDSSFVFLIHCTSAFFLAQIGFTKGGFSFVSQIGMATAIRYGLTRRAFSLTPNGLEVLLLDYPSHQRRLIPLLAKTYCNFTSYRNKCLRELVGGFIYKLTVEARDKQLISYW